MRLSKKRKRRKKTRNNNLVELLSGYSLKLGSDFQIDWISFDR